MTNKIIITEFAKFLKENKVYTEYRINLGQCSRAKYTSKWFNEFKDKLLIHFAKNGDINKSLAKNLINYAFAWSDTPQGHHFWNCLSRKWSNIVNEKNLYIHEF